ncbi:hypothetical protein PG994_005120 [Apiospora phragmitis]|uniref:Amine oxidase n=1 Tax=Apiospora phragmitis TaxID=2905665 RepID=A0ABR1VSH7_9PEZI
MLPKKSRAVDPAPKRRSRRIQTIKGSDYAAPDRSSPRLTSGTRRDGPGRTPWEVRRKDTQPRGADPFNYIDPTHSLVNSTLITGGEDLLHCDCETTLSDGDDSYDGDLVVYFNAGSHHIPHSGDDPKYAYVHKFVERRVQPAQLRRPRPEPRERAGSAATAEAQEGRRWRSRAAGRWWWRRC